MGISSVCRIPKVDLIGIASVRLTVIGHQILSLAGSLGVSWALIATSVPFLFLLIVRATACNFSGS